MLDNELKNESEVGVMRAALPEFGHMEGSSSLASPSLGGMPEIPNGGLLVRVTHAGASYAEGMLRKSQLKPMYQGVEVAGVVQDVSASLLNGNGNFNTGDHVIIYPDEDQVQAGFNEYLAVEDVESVEQVPHSVPLEVAAMIPGAGLAAYSAVTRARPHVEKLQNVKSCVNVLIVGAGTIGLWAVRIANSLIGPNTNKVRVFVADNSIDKLLAAQDHGCYDIIHWNEEDHEQYIIERTLDACRGGVDVIIDLVSSPRTMMRSLKILNREGLILVGGNTMSEVRINLNTLAAKQQSIVGIPKGTQEEMRELLSLVASHKVLAPEYHVYRMEEAGQVFENLAQCKLTSRAILCLGHLSSTQAYNNN